jgi:hypothetical protein
MWVESARSKGLQRPNGSVVTKCEVRHVDRGGVKGGVRELKVRVHGVGARCDEKV